MTVRSAKARSTAQTPPATLTRESRPSSRGGGVECGGCPSHAVMTDVSTRGARGHRVRAPAISRAGEACRPTLMAIPRPSRPCQGSPSSLLALGPYEAALTGSAPAADHATVRGQHQRRPTGRATDPSLASPLRRHGQAPSPRLRAECCCPRRAAVIWPSHRLIPPPAPPQAVRRSLACPPWPLWRRRLAPGPSPIGPRRLCAMNQSYCRPRRAPWLPGLPAPVACHGTFHLRHAAHPHFSHHKPSPRHRDPFGRKEPTPESQCCYPPRAPEHPEGSETARLHNFRVAMPRTDTCPPQSLPRRCPPRSPRLPDISDKCSRTSRPLGNGRLTAQRLISLLGLPPSPLEARRVHHTRAIGPCTHQPVHQPPKTHIVHGQRHTGCCWSSCSCPAQPDMQTGRAPPLSHRVRGQSRQHRGGPPSPLSTPPAWHIRRPRTRSRSHHARTPRPCPPAHVEEGGARASLLRPRMHSHSHF